MPRDIGCLSFDFDTRSGFAARGLTTPRPVSCKDLGVGGILNLLASRDIRSSW